MARVVYEGVGGGGDLFAGTKFFILQRVPTRNTWLELIQSNGGEVVKIEKNADYIIADHARKDCPPGSLSWKWIEACVKNGRLEDVDKYGAGPAQGTVREVGSAQPARNGRILFTDAEDAWLMKWVSRAERNGVSTKGNELYKQIEMRNPRHPYQSWRHRWINYVSKRPRPEPADEEEDFAEILPPRPKIRTGPRVVSKGGSKVASHSGPSTSKPQPAKRTRQREDGPQSPPLPQTPWAAGNSFTKAENANLVREADFILTLDKDQAIDAWIAWATKYPTHSPQEWRNHFKHEIIPTLAEEEKELDEDEYDDSGEGDAIVESGEAEVKKDQEEKSAKQPSTYASPSSFSKDPVLNEGPSNKPDIRHSQGSSGKISSAHSTPNQAVDPTTIDEKLFEHLLKIVADELDLNIELQHLICGRKIKLFELWQAVLSAEFGGFDNVNGRRLWPKVAKKLNFSEARDPTAAADLQTCYSENLADMEECRTEFREGNPYLTDSQERKLLDEQLLETSTRDAQGYKILENNEVEGGVEEDEENDYLDRPNSSSVQGTSHSSAKREIDVDRTPTGSLSKRQKIDRGKGRAVEEVERAIPSTPEDVISGSYSAKPYGVHQSKDAVPQIGSNEEPGEISPFVSPMRQPNLASRRLQSHLEPETQDFHFEIQDRSSAVHPSSSPERPRSINDASDEMADYSSPLSLTESEKNEALTVFIERMQALGYEESDIGVALHATTFSETNAAEALESLKQGRGVPRNIRGVWTKNDDEALKGDQDSRAFGNILAKHGVERIQERRTFLEGLEENE